MTIIVATEVMLKFFFLHTDGGDECYFYKKESFSTLEMQCFSMVYELEMGNKTMVPFLLPLLK